MGLSLKNPITLSELIMIRKSLFLTFLAITGILLLTSSTEAEARRHCRSHASLGLNVGVGTGYSDAYVTRRYARPVVVSTPVYVPNYYYPCYNQVYAYPSPAYVEEVYVAPAPRIGLSGLSFSWNFFK